MRDARESDMSPRDVTGPDGRPDELAVLLTRCGEGDRAALRAVYDREAARLRRVALRITGDPMLADDVTHDVFVHLMVSARRFDSRLGPARAFLTMTTRFAAMEARRQRRRQPAGLDETPENVTESVLAAARADDGRVLADCLQRLEPKARRMIVLSFAEGRSHGELAALFGLPLGTTKSIIRRGLLALRRCLDQ